MRHVSEKWIRAADDDAPPQRMDFSRRRHAVISSRFRARADRDGTGFLQSLIEIEGENGIYPASPPTLRGKLGSWLVRAQGGALWWLIRTLRIRDRALRGAYELMRDQIEASETAQASMNAELQELRRRIEKLENQRSLRTAATGQ